MRLEIYEAESMFDGEMAANNKLIDALTVELKKLECGAMGVAKQTERKKKHRLIKGKEKAHQHYINERNNVEIAMKLKQEKLQSDYDLLNKTYYIPKIDGFFEQGSEDASDEEVIPTYSPSYYAKKAQLDEVVRQNAKYQQTIDLNKQRINGTLLTSKPKVVTPVVMSEKDKAEWAKLDASKDAHTKAIQNNRDHRVRNLEMKSKVMWEAKEAKLKDARAAAQVEDTVALAQAEN